MQQDKIKKSSKLATVNYQKTSSQDHKQYLREVHINKRQLSYSTNVCFRIFPTVPS